MMFRHCFARGGRIVGNSSALRLASRGRGLSAAPPAKVPKYGQYFIPTVEESVNFQVGQPAPSMLPLDIVRESARVKLLETDPLLLQYGYISGYPAFRQTLVSLSLSC